MEPFATIEQYEERYGAVEDDVALSACLEDASAAIVSVLEKHGLTPADMADDPAERLMRTCRSVAHRLMPAGDAGVDVPMGAESASVTAGPYTQSFTFGSSYGTPRLLPSELEMLGIGGGAGRVLHPQAGINAACPVWWTPC